ncbi:MAG: hypothetical protein LUH03_09315 [Oscillospiraceae bacterium]|nr:hypothetical protein [Oscillospiraceae bacterium]
MDSNLHSLNKLSSEIESYKVFLPFMSQKIQGKYNSIKEHLTDMDKTMTDFNRYFTDIGWCAYDSMNLALMKKAVFEFETSGTDAGERILLDYYETDIKKEIPVLLRKAAPFAQRADLIQKAFDDHFEDRYYASIPQFLIIIDGSVNDFTKSKGFFAGNTDVTAWDCLVGCSDGLSKMKNIFNKKRTKTNSDEIRIPYRNGILHGRDLNYGNEYVSCKCVALMFAIADWMCMKDSEDARKEKFEKENNPQPILKSIESIAKNTSAKGEMKQWKPRNIIVGVDISTQPTAEDCEKYPYLIPVVKTFDAWKSKNYGFLSSYLKELFDYEESETKRAGECRKLFSSKTFCSYEIKEVKEEGCSKIRIQVQADWESNEKHYSEFLECGIIYRGEGKEIALPWKGNGTWRLVPWNFRNLLKS